MYNLYRRLADDSDVILEAMPFEQWTSLPEIVANLRDNGDNFGLQATQYLLEAYAKQGSIEIARLE